MQLTIDQFSAYPNSSSSSDWALLKAAHPVEAGKSAAILRGARRYRLEDSIQSIMSPCSLDTALESYWLAEIEDRPKDG